MRKAILFLLILGSAASGLSQTVLLDVDRKLEKRQTDFGPNLKKFTHAVFRVGAVASSDKPGARIVYGGSVNLALGIRNKFKIGKVFSAGYDIEASYTDYKLKQQNGKILPDSTLNNKTERLDYTGLGIGYFNRFNFDPGRGNHLGAFLDIGIMGMWDLSIKHIVKNKLPDGTIVKGVVKHLPYVNNINAKLVTRIGYNHYTLYASYRITELFKPSFNYPDLPAMIIGIEASPF